MHGNPRLRSQGPRTARALLGACSVLLALAASTGVATGVTDVAGAASAPGILLALGDSLAAGYQPVDGHSAPPVDHRTGYADQGYPNSYAADIAGARHLELIDLGCPGETTSSMVHTPANAACKTTYSKEFGVTSQLRAAEVYLNRHRGEVKLLTFDLGANDVDACSSSGFNLSCFTNGESTVTRQLPGIISTLKTTLHRDDRKATFVTMNYYDPFLGVAYEPGGSNGSTDALLSVIASDSFNSKLGTIFKHANLVVANVATAFKTGTTLPLVSYGGRRLPTDVAKVCELTWMCPLHGSRTSQNIHPNAAGYRTIAKAFTRALAS